MAIINQSWFKRVADSGGKQDDPSPPFEGISAGMIIRGLLFFAGQIVISVVSFYMLLVYIFWAIFLGLCLMVLPRSLSLDGETIGTALAALMQSWPAHVSGVVAILLLMPLIMALSFRNGLNWGNDDISRARIKAARTSADSSWQ